MRSLLWAISLVYRLVMLIRNWCYDQGCLKIYRVDAPVISVGNLTTGGTGKTPLVIWLVEFLQSRYRIGVVSRGYAAARGQLNDEGRELTQRLDRLLLVQHPDRVAAAREALTQLGTTATDQQPKLIIADDGFQHRRLAREVDLLLVDATQPFGFQRLLPAGYLRESLTSVRRADAVILTRCDLVSTQTRNLIKRRFASYHPNLIWAETATTGTHWLASDGGQIPLEALAFQPVLAFCGLGNPENFRRTLQRYQLQVLEFVAFPDHHPYSKQEVLQLIHRGQSENCQALVCTHKDLVKVAALGVDQMPIWALQTQVEWESGQRELQNLILDRLAKWESTR